MAAITICSDFGAPQNKVTVLFPPIAGARPVGRVEDGYWESEPVEGSMKQD